MASRAAIFAIGKPGGLAGEGRGARDPRVHLDHDHAPGLRVDRELDVRPAGLDPDLADDGARGVAHDLVLAVGQGLGGSDRHRIPGVDAHGVEVLDGADHHEVVGPVAHDLELVLLPPDDRLLDQHLVHGREVEAAIEARSSNSSRL